MNRIDVVSDKETRKFKVLINFIQRGPLLTQPNQANQEAIRIRQKEMPYAELHTFGVTA